MTLRVSKIALTVVLSLASLAGPTAPALAQVAALSNADQALVGKATAYLQGLQQVEGRFEQTNPRGQTQTGDIFLRRPGKARFAYDPPSGLLVVSDGRNVSVWDARLKTFDRAPLAATPLAILLAAKVSLDQDVEVIRVGRYDDGFFVSARNAHGQSQTEGYITLVFGGTPLTLRGWTSVDGQGQATRVKITDLKPQAVSPDLFVLNDPRTPEEKGLRPKAVVPKAGNSQSNQRAGSTAN